MARPSPYSTAPPADAGLDPAAASPVPHNYRTPGTRRSGLGPTTTQVLGALSAMDRMLL